jgi:hypothetical protein
VVESKPGGGNHPASRKQVTILMQPRSYPTAAS